MNYGLQKLPISDSPIDGSLTEDLRYLRGGTDGIEWLILYEEKFGLFENRYTMLYCKVVILTPEGRHLAEFGREEIWNKCKFKGYNDSVKFYVALSLAINRWDDAHPRKHAPNHDFDDAEEL